MISIKGLHKFFHKGRQNEIHVINDINLELPDKGMVAIFGKSGCGKTTLLNVIGGLDAFAAGSLTLDGQDIRQDTDVIRNRYIGYIFQNYNLNKQESCFDNVANALRLCGMTNKEQIEERVTAALQNVDMEKYGKRLPDTLSGGQQQRIAIARAIVKNPRIILADEPTGNLDEANTVMIMDLLKAISKEHLVLLVTHEANLVDYYCDTVIELSDGKVVNIKTNSDANGFASKNKNDIYLGELPKNSVQGSEAVVEYYGEPCDEPVRLQVIHTNGKLYIKINTPKVQVLDESSEIRLREGVYEEIKNQEAANSFDMSKLPPIKANKFGNLFTFVSSLKSGYAENFQKRKKGKKVLKRCMGLFASVIVLMSAIFGTSFSTIIDAKKSYNHNVFYIYTGDAETSDKLNDALGKSESGIDYLRLFYDYYYQSGNQYISFYMGNFESFQVNSYEYDFSTNAVFMDVTAAKELSVVTGSKELSSDYEILITTAVADALLERSGLGHISKYKDLIGLLTSSLYIDGNSLRVAGVVQADEPAIYLSELALAKHINEMNPTLCQLAPSNMEVATGTAVMLFRTYSGGAKLPKEGDTIQIHGMDIQISKIISVYNSYPEWLAGNKINKQKDENAYFSQILKEEKPQLSPDSDEFLHEVDEMVNERYYEYLDYYYSELDNYLLEYHIMEGGSMEAWLAVEKGLVDAKFNFTEHEDYYKAFKYKEMYGKYPTRAEMKQLASSLPELDDIINRYYKMYDEEYYNSQSYGYYGEHAYLMNERDFITMSRRVGITDNSAIPLYYSSVDERCYTMIHSVNPELTEKWIAENLKDHESPTEYLPAVVTPDHLYEDIMANNKVVILSSFITMAVILTVMSICMYFIMRSSLMSRIKEIGIYRAIGVSKKNLVFKFIVEALVLTTLTVFIGYLATSAFMAACLALSPMVETIFFYPMWLAIAVLVILYALCLFCGTLPITLLLRKTPSEILAKYDI